MNAEQYVDEALSIAMYAMRAGIHTTLEAAAQVILYLKETCS